jgi:GST-like protein
MIELYFWPTPNGKKVTIFLEEAAVEYRITPVNILAGDQFKPEYLALNPNHRMPTLVDHAPTDGAGPLAVFESGAILIYLAEKYGQFWSEEPRRRYAAAQWLTWQMANFGAKVGEFNHFNRLGGAQGDQSYALGRYANETNRLYGVLNWGLYKARYLGGDEYSIADMAVFPWANNWKLHGQDLGEFKHVARWLEEVAARPAVRRGMDVGQELTVDPTTFNAEQRERLTQLLFNQRAIPTPE